MIRVWKGYRLLLLTLPSLADVSGKGKYLFTESSKLDRERGDTRIETPVLKLSGGHYAVCVSFAYIMYNCKHGDGIRLYMVDGKDLETRLWHKRDSGISSPHSRPQIWQNVKVNVKLPNSAAWQWDDQELRFGFFVSANPNRSPPTCKVGFDNLVVKTGHCSQRDFLESSYLTARDCALKSYPPPNVFIKKDASAIQCPFLSRRQRFRVSVNVSSYTSCEPTPDYTANATGESLSIRSTCRSMHTGYLGCFRDSRNKPVFDTRQNSPSLTVTKCRTRCGLRGFGLAGLRGGDQCFCAGLPWGRFDTQSYESVDSCNMPCPGDPSTNCGGADATDVYEIPTHNIATHKVARRRRFQTDNRNTAERAVDGSVYFISNANPYYSSCYLPRQGVQNSLRIDLGGLYALESVSILLSPAARTPIDITLKYGHSPVDSKQRVCSTYQRSYSEMEKYRYVPLMCEHDAQHITLAQGPEDWTPICEVRAIGRKLASYYACIEDVVLKFFPHQYRSEKQTVGSCVLHCREKGYLIAGLQNGNVCHCGATSSTDHLINIYQNGLVFDRECNVACAGDPYSDCGGVGALSIYAAGMPISKQSQFECMGVMSALGSGTDISKGRVLVLRYRETPADAYTFLAARYTKTNIGWQFSVQVRGDGRMNPYFSHDSVGGWYQGKQRTTNYVFGLIDVPEGVLN